MTKLQVPVLMSTILDQSLSIIQAPSGTGRVKLPGASQQSFRKADLALMRNTDNSETTARAAILGLSASFQSIRLLVLEVMSITLALR